MSTYIRRFGFLIAAFLTSSAFAQDIRGGIAERGQAMAEIWCSNCHLVTDDKEQTALVDVPTFTSIARRLPDDSEVLAAFIANPHPTQMPDLSLSRNDIADLLAYIATLNN